MDQTTPTTMRAVALDRFGGPETLVVQTLNIPEIEPNEVLVRVEWAGVGEWDPFEREGGYAEMQGVQPKFPYILGSEGAGTIAAVGEGVSAFSVGDPVYSPSFLNPKGGFYAEYAVVSADLVSHIPGDLTLEQAGVMGGVGLTALRGLDDTLHLKQGESILILGAGGGIGHVAVQLAKRMGARVLGVASGDDGVVLAKQVGADTIINGRDDDVLTAARTFAPEGLDVALLTVGGEAADKAVQAMRENGRVVYPRGIEPEPKARDGVQISAYDGAPDKDIITRLNALIGDGPFNVHVARTFSLDQAADAHRALDTHYLGKLALKVR